MPAKPSRLLNFQNQQPTATYLLHATLPTKVHRIMDKYYLPCLALPVTTKRTYRMHRSSRRLPPSSICGWSLTPWRDRTVRGGCIAYCPARPDSELSIIVTPAHRSVFRGPAVIQSGLLNSDGSFHVSPEPAMKSGSGGFLFHILSVSRRVSARQEALADAIYGILRSARPKSQDDHQKGNDSRGKEGVDALQGDRLHMLEGQGGFPTFPTCRPLTTL